MNIDESIPKLKELNERLTSLFADPHPGLGSWLMAVARIIREMAIITGEVKS